MKYVITGGLGFIGLHLVERLTAEGHSVRILDPGLPKKKLPERAEHWQGDGTKADFLYDCLRGTDVIFHLAGSLLPNDSNRRPGEDVSGTLTANLQLMTCAVESGVQKLVYASSGGTIYGIPQHYPVEETHPTDPISSYGIVKLATEKYLALFERLHGLKFASLRYSNPYGEGQNPFRNFGVIAAFLGAIATESEITIWGDGSAVRDFIYVRDAIDATVLAANYAGNERIFNIGSGEGTSLRELVDLIESVTGKTARRKYLAARGGDVPAVVLDRRRAREAFGWEPATTLSTGLARTWDWCRQVPRDGK